MKRALPAVALLAACERAEYSCAARVSDGVNTVLLLEVTASEPVEAEVVFRSEGVPETSAGTKALVADQPVTYTVLGVPALADVDWSVRVDGEEVCAGTDATRNLPTGLAEFVVNTFDEGLVSDARYVLFAMGGSTAQGLTMVDRFGRIVWYLQPPDRSIQWVQPYWLDQHALYNGFDAAHTEDVATITTVDAEANVVESLRTVEGHHTFTPLEPGSFAYLRRDKRMWFDPIQDQQQPVVGDAIVEVDAEGNERVVFNAWDWLPVRVTPEFYQPFYRDARDWTHANAIHWDPGANTFLTSFSNLDTIVEIDRASGQPLRWFGIDGEEPYGYAEGTRAMEKPHDPRWTGPDTFTTFVTFDSVGRSGLIEYRIDEVNHELVEIWSYGFGDGEPMHRAFFLGQGWRQENGNTMVKWAQTGRLVEVTPEGHMAWDLALASGAIFQEAHVLSTLYGDTP